MRSASRLAIGLAAGVLFFVQLAAAAKETRFAGTWVGTTPEGVWGNVGTQLVIDPTENNDAIIYVELFLGRNAVRTREDSTRWWHAACDLSNRFGSLNPPNQTAKLRGCDCKAHE